MTRPSHKIVILNEARRHFFFQIRSRESVVSRSEESLLNFCQEKE
jgi:hypothetical protein